MGGLRVLGADVGGSRHGAFMASPGVLSTDFCVNLLDVRTDWRLAARGGVCEERDRASGEVRWTGTRVDLLFGSNAELRALAEVHACDDNRRKFVDDFVAAWRKVMNHDRFDLR